MSMFKIIDTHTHLCDSVFDTDRDEVLENAASVGIVSILLVSETFEDARKNIKLAEEYTMLHPLAGLYPAHTDVNQAQTMIDFIRQNRDSLAGIGEVGLDFWTVKEESKRTVQEEIFVRFVKLSGELSLPLNVHSRSAGRHVVDLLLKHGAEKVQLHAFDGKASTASPAVEAGYFFSIPPSVVRSRQKQKLVKYLPISSLLVETDSPVLGPVSGKRNEPMNILKAIDAITEIKGISIEQVIESVFYNTRKLYGISIAHNA